MKTKITVVEFFWEDFYYSGSFTEWIVGARDEIERWVRTAEIINDLNITEYRIVESFEVDDFHVAWSNKFLANPEHYEII